MVLGGWDQSDGTDGPGRLGISQTEQMVLGMLGVSQTEQMVLGSWGSVRLNGWSWEVGDQSD